MSLTTNVVKWRNTGIIKHSIEAASGQLKNTVNTAIILLGFWEPRGTRHMGTKFPLWAAPSVNHGSHGSCYSTSPLLVHRGRAPFGQHWPKGARILETRMNVTNSLACEETCFTFSLFHFSASNKGTGRHLQADYQVFDLFCLIQQPWFAAGVWGNWAFMADCLS